MSDIKKIAASINNRAYDMYPVKAEPSRRVEDPFPMFSYERVSCIFWRGFIEELLSRGLDESQVEWLLRSKEMRWMFDGQEREIEQFAASLVNDGMINRAKVGE